MPVPVSLGAAHPYVLTVWALDDSVDPSGTVDAGTLRKAMEGHVLWGPDS